MNGIGSRLKEERVRMGMSQKAFGEIGGVASNAQGRYERGTRTPQASYLAAMALNQVDVVYVLTGFRARLPLTCMSETEEWVLGNYRSLEKQDQAAIRHLTTTLAERPGPYSPRQSKLSSGDQ